jgi:HSP20 family protein
MITVTFRPGQNRNLHTAKQPDYMLVNWHVAGQSHLWRPPTDVLELEDRYLIRIEIAGMDEKDFDISLDQNILSVHGVRPDIPDRRAYHQMEINFGEFITVVEIPGQIDAGSATAEYQGGFLLINLPKAHSKHIHLQE